MRLRLLAALALALPLLLAGQGQAATKGTLTHGSYHQPGGLTRTYLLYQPAGLRPGRPVMVMLHGCNQTAPQVMTASRFNALADHEKIAIVYPQQVVSAGSSAPAGDGNGIGCWNWFLPEDQARGSGEPGVLAGLAQAVTKAVKGDRKRVYVEGVSAGAAMSVILGATYPDVFAGVGSIAGCSYSTCGDGSGALTHQAMGPRARIVPMFIENGSADVLNPLPQSVDLAQSWLGADDLADDGSANQSVSRQPSSSTTTLPKGLPMPGSGDPCIHNESFLCLGGILGLSDYPLTVQTWQHQGKDIVQLLIVHGMNHAQPDAPAGEPYTDPQGPDVTTLSWKFFSKHRLP
ncbi:MAG: putative esterase [Frankiales bacterium]|nr:putative esterase [Frankiales bacterium]